MGGRETCKQCETRQYLADLFTPANNPKGYDQIYGKDHGGKLTIEDLANRLRSGVREGLDTSEMCDLLDREFLFGAWRDELEAANPSLLRDLRGLIISLAERSE